MGKKTPMDRCFRPIFLDLAAPAYKKYKELSVTHCKE